MSKVADCAVVAGSNAGSLVSGTPPAAPAPDKVALAPDGFKGSGARGASEADRQRAAVEAAKAAQAGLPAGATAPSVPVPESTLRKFAGAAKALLESDSALGAAARGALRLVPIVGFYSGARDEQDVHETFADPGVSPGRKVLVSAKAVASAVTLGAFGLLAVTLSPVFLPWGLAAGAVALSTDLALGRLRSGHW